MAKKIKNAPGWLGLSEDRSSFVYIPERAEIVKQIFELSLAGMGGYTIAKLLNSKKIQAFGTSKRWDQSTIHNMLSSRATVGEYQRKQTIDDKECPVGDPVPGYYPAVIDEAVFLAAQEARQDHLASGRGRKGAAFTNLFAGLATCFYCQSPVRFHSNGNNKSMICSTVLGGAGCYRFRWSYIDFENTFLECADSSGRYPKLSELLVELRNSRQANSEEDVFNARASIYLFIRSSLIRIIVCAAGETPPDVEPGKIRRDHPGRFLRIVFPYHSTLVAVPAVAPQAPKGRKIASKALTRALNISPRQAELTALLVEGFELKEVAERLGMSFETGRWHLREIFRKTQTHSQTELRDLVQRTVLQIDPERTQ